MAKIAIGLVEALVAKTGLSKQQVYKRIQQISHADFLPRHLAAIKFAAESRVPISKYATSEELAQLRQSGSPIPPSTAGLEGVPTTPRSGKSDRRATGRKSPKTTPNQVFVVHGRDHPAREAVFAFLRSLGVKPIEWTKAISLSKKAAPFIEQVLDAGFANARAVVVLFTPDDLVKLRPDLLSDNDPAYERREVGQARPNVLFEAGRAFATHPDRTIMVQLGSMRPFSDVAGRHVVHMGNDTAKRQEFALKLQNAGCEIDLNGTDWMTAGNFIDPEQRPQRSKGRKKA